MDWTGLRKTSRRRPDAEIARSALGRCCRKRLRRVLVVRKCSGWRTSFQELGFVKFNVSHGQSAKKRQPAPKSPLSCLPPDRTACPTAMGGTPRSPVQSYRKHMRDFADIDVMEIWYPRITTKPSWRHCPPPSARPPPSASPKGRRTAAPSWSIRTLSKKSKASLAFTTRRGRFFRAEESRHPGYIDTLTEVLAKNFGGRSARPVRPRRSSKRLALA